jgi:hypothetical protein
MAQSTKKKSELVIAAGLEQAFLGVGVRHGKSNVAVYSLSMAVDILHEGGMSREDARNMLYDRVREMDFGESTPIWVEEMSVDELRLLSSEIPDDTIH